MTAVFIAIVILLGLFIIFAFVKMAKINNNIDNIYKKSLSMQGQIEDNTARSMDNYLLIARVNTELDDIKSTVADLHKHEPVEEPSKEVDAELENLIPEKEQTEEDELSVRRNIFVSFRNLGKSIKEAGELLGVSYSTAKRYEQWRKANKV